MKLKKIKRKKINTIETMTACNFKRCNCWRGIGDFSGDLEMGMFAEMRYYGPL